MANATIKITSLPNVGSNLSTTAIFPVVTTNNNLTEKVTVGTVGNLLLSEAGNLLEPAFVSTIAYSVSNAAQPNITSVGTLTTLEVSGPIEGNLTIPDIANLKIDGGPDGYFIQTDGNGNLSWSIGSSNNDPSGSNTQVQFNDAGAFGSNANFTYNKVAGALAAPLMTTSTVYNLNGISIENSDLTHGATAAVILPVNGSTTSPVQINNTYGNVGVTAGANPSSLKNWTFNSDSTLNVPGFIKGPGTASIGILNSACVIINSATTDSSSTSGILVDKYAGIQLTANSNVTGDGTTKTWTFNTNGNLVLPGNTFAVNYANGTQVPISGGGSGNTGNIIFNESNLTSNQSNAFINFNGQGSGDLILGTNDNASAVISVNGNDVPQSWSFDATGVLRFPNESNIRQIGLLTQFNSPENGFIALNGISPQGNNVSRVSVDGESSVVTLTTYNITEDTSYNWVFDDTGNVTLPGNTFTVNYANGGPVLIGGNANTISNDLTSVSIPVANGNINFNVDDGLAAWEFNNEGTIVVPFPNSNTFPLPLSSAYYVPTLSKPTLDLSSAPWELTGAFAYEPNGGVTTQLDNIWPQVINPGYTTGDSFAFDSSVTGIGGYVLSVTLGNVVNAGPAGWTANPQVNQPFAYPSTVESSGSIKVTSNGNSWVFGTNGVLTVPGTITRDDRITINSAGTGSNNTAIVSADGDLGRVFIRTDNGTTLKTWQFDVGGNLSFPDSTVTTGANIKVGTTSIFAVTTSSLTSVSALCYIGLPDEYVADIEFNDDITAVQVGWIVIIDATPYTVSAIDPSPPANQFRATVTGATFVSGTNYTFTNPVPVEATWSIDQYGTLTTPAGGTINQFNNDFKIEVAGSDIIDLRTAGGDFIFDAEGNLNIKGPINSTTGVSRLDLTGGNVYLTSTDNDTTVLGMNTTTAQLYAGVNVNLISGVLLPSLETDYTDSRTMLEESFTLNSGEVGYPWGITLPVSYLTYNELIQLPADTFPNQASCTVQANNTQNTWELWQDTIAQSNVRITSNELTWTFDYNGNLSVPGNLIAVTGSPAPSISGFNSVSAIEFKNGTSNVTINANSNLWNFDSTGNLVIPGSSGGLIKTVANGSIGIAAINNGSDNPAQMMSWTVGETNPDTIISTYANSATVMTDVNGAIKTWSFDNAGNLTLPANTFAINYANGTQVSLGGSSSSIANGNSNVSIATSNGNVTINAVGGTRITATSTGANVTGTLTSSGKIGYASGSTVTQATSRGTGVTLNALSGEVTLFSASMTAGQVDFFTMSNDKANAGDMIVCTTYGGSLGTYLPMAYCSIDGQVILTIRNLESYTTGTEAPVIKFIVVKAPIA